jgi:hypothetical protein
MAHYRQPRGPGAPRLYAGTLLNQPHQLKSIQAGASIIFTANPGVEDCVMVTPEILEERWDWQVTACNQCGFHEMLDPPSVMFQTRFPQAEPNHEVLQFSAHCPLCGGMLFLARL